MTPAAPPSSPRAATGLYPALALTAASQIAATASVLALTGIPTLVAATTGIRPYELGYQVSLIYGAGVLFSMMSGGLVKRWGAGRVGQIALGLAAIGFLGLATGSAAGVFIASVLIGVGYALNNPTSSHVLNRLAPAARRNLVFSIKQAGVPVGGIVAALAIPPVAHAIGWQAALALFALAPLALAAAYQAFIPVWDDDRQPDAPVLRGVIARQKVVWTTPDLRALSLIGLFFSALQLSLSTFIVAMLIEQFAWAPIAAGLAAAAAQTAGAFGRIFWGLVADRVGSGFGVLAAIGLLSAASVSAFALLPWSPALGVAALVVAGGSSLAWNGVWMAETARASAYVARGKGTFTGDAQTFIFLGVVVGPSLFSALYELTHDYAATYRILALGGAVGAALAAIRMRRRGEAWKSAQ